MQRRVSRKYIFCNCVVSFLCLPFAISFWAGVGSAGNDDCVCMRKFLLSMSLRKLLSLHNGVSSWFSSCTACYVYKIELNFCVFSSFSFFGCSMSALRIEIRDYFFCFWYSCWSLVNICVNKQYFNIEFIWRVYRPMLPYLLQMV